MNTSLDEDKLRYTKETKVFESKKESSDEFKINTRTCENGCCQIKIRKYVERPLIKKGFCRKAGVFFYDSGLNAVLLVQSRGQLWGPPKGSIELHKGETDLECAIRETREETGLIINEKDLEDAEKFSIKDKATYYFLERSSDEVSVQGDMTNDANGIGWIKIDCIKKSVQIGTMMLNQHCKILFQKFFGIVFQICDFIKVDSRETFKRSRQKTRRQSRVYKPQKVKQKYPKYQIDLFLTEKFEKQYINSFTNIYQTRRAYADNVIETHHKNFIKKKSGKSPLKNYSKSSLLECGNVL